MLHLCIKAENTKLRRSVIWIACFLIPIIPAIMGTFNYLQNLGILTGEWYSLWTQFTLFYAIFFYSPLIALYCSYLWRLEHLDHNWNVLMTMPVRVSDVLFGKLFIVCKVTLITQAWMVLLFVLCGKLSGLPGLPPATIYFWALRGTVAAVAIGALQLLLSMCIRSFALPIGIALGGSIGGLLISNMGCGLFFPYSLMLMGMNSNSYDDQLAGDTWKFLLAVLLYFLLFIAISLRILKKKDVRA